MNELKAMITEKMKTIRADRQLNLDQAAEITGISKAMLSQIERGQSIPTITTLWKIATGYKVPLTYFVEEEKSDYSLVDFHSSGPIYEEEEKMRTYTLFPYNPAQNFEMLYIEFDGGCVHESARHLNGVEEYLFVLSGSLELCLGQERVKIGKDQCFRFKADVPHSYRLPSETPCTVLNIIFYP
ncbi:XRE family transcriptional regulator [Lachnospiraceae bacterium 54-53]